MLQLSPAAPDQQEAGRPHHLSFVTMMSEGGYNYWNVEPAGSFSADCELGRKLGVEFLTFIGQHSTNGNATLLGCIVQSMIENAAAGRRVRGAEIGFMAQINEYAMAVAVVVERPGALSA
jgi:hypothetical protein